MSTADDAAKLLVIDQETKAFLVGQALEAYHIAAHFDSDENPALDESDPLRALLDRYARGAVALAFSKLGSGQVARMHDAYYDYFTGLSVELDLHAVEKHDGA